MGKKQFDLRGLGGSYDFTETQPEIFILILNACAPLRPEAAKYEKKKKIFNETLQLTKLSHLRFSWRNSFWKAFKTIRYMNPWTHMKP